jgi:hypothetical protein
MSPASFQHSFAVFSDIHANDTALKACLADLKRISNERGQEFECMILGDVLDAGPCPVSTLARVEEIASVHIRGNHEDYLWECSNGLHRARYRSGLWRYVPWTLEQVGHDEFARYYKQLRFDWRSADGMLWLAHASADKNDVVPDFFSWSNATNSADLWYRGPCKCLRIVGHSHLTGIYPQKNGEVWINAGSVGYPYVAKTEAARYQPHATYVYGQINSRSGEVEVCIRLVPYELDELVADYRSAAVLDLCGPYAHGVLLQTVLNKSVIFPAFQRAKAMGIDPLAYDVALANWLGEQGYEAEIERIMARKQ